MATDRPNHWTATYPCPHNEVAYSATETWCETCGSTLHTVGRAS